jgi:uncharacterized membrane protein YedE/YeeE
MIKYFLVLLSGILFSLGLVISTMINPNVVLNFLDVFGTWDPSLIFVMFGALITVVIGFKIIFKQQAPLYDKSFHLPKKQNLDVKLISGAIIFGVGWGLSGYCPGPAIANLAYGQSEILLFILAMIIGFKCSGWLQESNKTS